MSSLARVTQLAANHHDSALNAIRVIEALQRQLGSDFDLPAGAPGDSALQHLINAMRVTSIFATKVHSTMDIFDITSQRRSVRSEILAVNATVRRIVTVLGIEMARLESSKEVLERGLGSLGETRWP